MALAIILRSFLSEEIRVGVTSPENSNLTKNYGILDPPKSPLPKGIYLKFNVMTMNYHAFKPHLLRQIFLVIISSYFQK